MPLSQIDDAVPAHVGRYQGSCCLSVMESPPLYFAAAASVVASSQVSSAAGAYPP